MSQNIGGNKIYAGNILPDSLKSYKYKAIGVLYAGANPGFQTREGGARKIIAQSEGRREIVGVIRVKNHDFTPKNHIFSNFRGGERRMHPPPPRIVWSDDHVQCSGIKNQWLVSSLTMALVMS